DLLGPHPRFRLHQANWPLVTAPEQEPPIMLLTSSDTAPDREGRITHTLIAPGSLLQGGRIDRSVLSPEVWIEPEADVQESILLDGVHIGRGAQVRRAILDRGTVIPPGARIGYDPTLESEEFTVSEKGITVVGSTPAIQAIHQYTA
ncbi:MAG: glucose-1-phosphate adenylyltransferase, partial [Candidatus Entotheonellia bacterium]